MSLLDVENVEKSFSNGFSLKDISFEIEDKGVYGFLGKSKSGKTALADILAGASEIDAGMIRFRDKYMYSSPKETAELKKKIGYVPQKCFFDNDMTVFEVLNFTGSVKRVEVDKKYRQIKEALELVGLSEKQDVLVKALSLSEKKRLSVANSLIANPSMIIMDEPLRSLDPNQAGEIKKLISMLGKRKVVIVFTSSPTEVEEFCEYTAIMSNGKIVLLDSVSAILEKLKAGGVNGLAAALNAFDSDKKEER